MAALQETNQRGGEDGGREGEGEGGEGYIPLMTELITYLDLLLCAGVDHGLDKLPDSAEGKWSIDDAHAAHHFWVVVLVYVCDLPQQRPNILSEGSETNTCIMSRPVRGAEMETEK